MTLEEKFALMKARHANVKAMLAATAYKLGNLAQRIPFEEVRAMERACLEALEADDEAEKRNG